MEVAQEALEEKEMNQVGKAVSNKCSEKRAGENLPSSNHAFF